MIGTAEKDRDRRGYSRINAAFFGVGIATFTLIYASQPLLPVLSRQFSLAPATSSLTISVTTGFLMLGALPVNFLARRWDRRKAIVVSLAAAGLIGMLQALSPAFWVLLVLRAAQGLALAGLPAIAVSFIAENVHRSRVGASMGLYVASSGLGGMTGRLLASLVSGLAGWRWALGAVGAFSLACTLIFFVTLAPAEARGAPGPDPRRLAAGRFASQVRRAVADADLRRIYAVAFLLMGGFVAVYNYLGFRLLAAPFGLSQTLVGLVFTCYIAGSVGSAAGGRLADRLGAARVLRLAIAVDLIGIALMLAGNIAVVVLGLLLLTAGFFAAHSVASGWAGRLATSVSAQATAVYSVVYYLGSSTGGTVGGFAYEHGGWLATSAFVACLGLAALAAALPLRTPDR